MMLRNFSVPRLIALCAAGVVALASTPASAWELAHGNRDNSGFANAVTAPAGKGSLSVLGLGKFAPGAGPVVALDGTVYVGTIEGELVALHADGSPFWSSRYLHPGQAIVASPVISSDGSVYVIGVPGWDPARECTRCPCPPSSDLASFHQQRRVAEPDRLSATRRSRTRCTQPAEHLAIRQRRSNHGPGSLSQQGHRRTFGQADRVLTHGPGAR